MHQSTILTQQRAAYVQESFWGRARRRVPLLYCASTCNGGVGQGMIIYISDQHSSHGHILTLEYDWTCQEERRMKIESSIYIGIPENFAFSHIFHAILAQRILCKNSMRTISLTPVGRAWGTRRWNMLFFSSFLLRQTTSRFISHTHYHIINNTVFPVYGKEGVLVNPSICNNNIISYSCFFFFFDTKLCC